MRGYRDLRRNIGTAHDGCTGVIAGWCSGHIKILVTREHLQWSVGTQTGNITGVRNKYFCYATWWNIFPTCDLNNFSCRINHSSSSRMSITMRHVSVLAFILGVGHVLSQDESGLPAGSEDILQYPYSETFSCEGQDYGYYADVQSGCQVSQNSRQATYTYKLQKE